MKSIKKYLIYAVLAAVSFSACTDELETSPTDRVAGTTIFSSADAATTAINGVYSLLYRPAYVSANTAHAYGHQSTLFAQDLMAEDVVQMVFNWYGWDYQLDYTAVSSTGTASRSYNVWNMHYTVISNCNYIIAEEGAIPGDPALTTSIVAQAFAMRAFCYFELIQGFQKTYLGHESSPGVPIYTERTQAGEKGNPRGTVQNVYDLINSDITHAIQLFESINKPVQDHSSNVDYYVAKGFQARIALVQGKWQEAYDAAAIARSRAGVKLLSSEDDILSGLSNISLSSNLWAMEQTSDQVQIYGSLYCALDPRASQGYGYGQRKCISSWLYGKISADDVRKQWFLDSNQGNATSGLNVNYGQMKRLSKALANWQGDFIFMRAEEMLLIQAEAKARLSQYPDARNLLKELIAVRMNAEGQAAYETYINALAEGNTLSATAIADTNTDPQNILEEVLLQRRIELWGEQGRIKDVLRLKQGYERDYPGTNHVQLAAAYNTGPESGAFLFKIPQSEFDGNENISSNEQNPFN